MTDDPAARLRFAALRRAGGHNYAWEAHRAGGVADRGIDVDDVWWLAGGVCYLCGEDVPQPGADVPLRDTASIDHVVPLSQGGGHTWSNVQLAHQGCNARRGRRPIDPLPPLLGQEGFGWE